MQRSSQSSILAFDTFDDQLNESEYDSDATHLDWLYSEQRQLAIIIIIII